MRTAFMIQALAIGFCCLVTVVPAQDKAVPGVEVFWVGEMRKVMQDGDLSAAIDLRKLATKKNLYALGPLEGLQGEVTIWDGKASIARIRDGKIAVSNNFDSKAIFLVYAQVQNWHEVPLPEGVASEKNLEDFVVHAAAKLGLDTKRPFPFAVKGTLKNVAFHVVNRTDVAPHSKEQHEKTKVHFTIENTPVRLIGFYSDHHHGVFTHHGSNIHIHAITEDGKQSGHVDSLQMGTGSALLLPRG